MRNLLIFQVLILFLISCSENQTTNQKLISEKINNSTFVYKLNKDNLDDTLKQYDSSGNLYLLQTWEDGKLLQTSVRDESGKIRKLKLVWAWKYSDSSHYHQDINDTSFLIIPYDDDAFTFFKKHASLTIESVYRDSITNFDLLNSPKDYLAVSICRGYLKRKGDNYILTTNSKRGDTIIISYYYPKMHNDNKTIRK